MMNERHYSISELAEIWNLSRDSINRLLLKEPGVLIFKNPRRGHRTYRTIRIPHSVAERIYRRMQNP
jgi:hypothetical protein